MKKVKKIEAKEEIPHIARIILRFVVKNFRNKNFESGAVLFSETQSQKSVLILKKLEDVHFYDLSYFHDGLTVKPDDLLQIKIYCSNIKGEILKRSGIIKSEPLLVYDSTAPLTTKPDITYSNKSYGFLFGN